MVNRSHPVATCWYTTLSHYHRHHHYYRCCCCCRCYYYYDLVMYRERRSVTTYYVSCVSPLPYELRRYQMSITFLSLWNIAAWSYATLRRVVPIQSTYMVCRVGKW